DGRRLERTAFIGGGRMRGPMSGRLLAAGHPVSVFDPSEAASAPLAHQGARVAGSAVEAARDAPLVFASLPSPDTVRSLAASIATVRGVEVFVDLSTSGPAASQAVAGMLDPVGIAAVDAPVSGGVKGAAAGT